MTDTDKAPQKEAPKDPRPNVVLEVQPLVIAPKALTIAPKE